ncbi:MAG: hypothetical protein R3A12_08275 [Ignavibacteria bacterium]
MVNDPAIEQQALLLKNDGWKPSWKSLVPLKPGGSKVPFFLRASGIWFGYTFSGDAYNTFRMISQCIYLSRCDSDGKEPPHYTIKWKWQLSM